MAFSKAVVAYLFFALLSISHVQGLLGFEDHSLIAGGAGTPPPVPSPVIDCGSACSARCKLASRQRMCKRACGTCCARCNCVPPGTSGNQEMCPCYAKLTTHGNRRKCP